MMPGGAAARTGAAAAQGRARSSAFKTLFRLPWLRRSSVAVPLSRRLPRLMGTALTFGFFGAVQIQIEMTFRLK